MLDSLTKALEEQVRDLYSAETQLIKALPRMAKAATSESLRDAFTSHLEETHGQVERLQQIAEMLGVKPGGKKCKAMEGLIEEGKEVLEEEGDEAVLDLALTGAAQRVEHYEIAAYGSACAMAAQLDLRKVVTLLEKSLHEETAADEKLNGLAEAELLPAAAMVRSSADVAATNGRVRSRQGAGMASAARAKR